MLSKKALLSSIVVIGLSAGIYATPINASAASNLKYGSRGTEVTALQNNLREVGLFSAKSTGYFGTITKSSVLKLQKKIWFKGRWNRWT